MSETPARPASDKPALFLRAQYIKDLSFENPRAPGSLFAMKEMPAMEVSVNLGAQKLDENIYELAIQVGVRAQLEKTTLFLIDMVYAGVVEVQNIPEKDLEPVLFINAAALVYPYARRVISDVSRDGGFPPVALEPLDFAGMYENNRNKKAAEAAAPTA